MSKVTKVTVLIQTAATDDDAVDMLDNVLEESKKIVNYEILDSGEYDTENFTEIYLGEVKKMRS